MEPLRFPSKRKQGRFETSLAWTRASKLIKDLSYSEGEVDLASKRVSTYYLDMKPTMFDPEGANLLANLILDKVANLGIDYIGGLAMGAVPLIAPVVMLAAQEGIQLPGFFVRKEIKDHGTRKLIEGVEDGDLKDKRIVILDDVTTTGMSAMQAVQAVQEAGASVVLVLSVVDREEGAAEFFAQNSIPFDRLFTTSNIRTA
jgi:orotate phosphoribosyltransferase